MISKTYVVKLSTKKSNGYRSGLAIINHPPPQTKIEMLMVESLSESVVNHKQEANMNKQGTNLLSIMNTKCM